VRRRTRERRRQRVECARELPDVDLLDLSGQITDSGNHLVRRGRAAGGDLAADRELARACRVECEVVRAE